VPSTVDQPSQLEEEPVDVKSPSTNTQDNDDGDDKIVSPHSSNSEETELSTIADASSVKSDDSSDGEEPEPPSADNDITISRVEGVMVVAAPLLKNAVSVDAPSDEVESQVNDAGADGGDAWETVEVRGRGNRSKKSSQSLSRTSSSIQSDTSPHVASGKKAKPTRTRESRKKQHTRKIAREVVNSVLDSVDDEVQKHRQEQQKPPPLPQQQQRIPSNPPVNPWRKGPPGASAASPSATSATTEPVVKVATLRDVVLGRHISSQKLSTNKVPPSVPAQTASHPSDKPKPRNEPLSPSKNIGQSRIRGKNPTADQNTAPTYQETVSAVSSSSNTVRRKSKDSPRNAEDRSSGCDLSADTDEAPQNRARASPARAPGEAAMAPPLPTLLSPGNANSANSSVASSLEVPHARRRHHHNSTADVDDVGYHLLDVCDRLSRDMSLFMSKRGMALNSRRRERGALLAALQDTVASIWPSRGHVEMYGSCATNLDLPSSDLDVVIIGLNPNSEMPNAASRYRSASLSSATLLRSQPSDEGSVDEPPPPTRNQSVGNFAALNTSANAENVVRLAAELESQPWAVQVNAIPTAYVPVVKVLADPSKLTSSSSSGEWMLQHQQIAARAASAAAGQTLPTSEISRTGSCLDPHQHYQPPWRGADVMNGLLKLDITFEGPEHGGLGSTEFSARVVAEACQETGSNPDATVLVQVLMVLKEILAQRKLNEPYSGGLSSYATLLLVLALLKERAVIREEIERAERQKQAMVTGDGNSSFSVPLEQSASARQETKASNSAVQSRTPSNAASVVDRKKPMTKPSLQKKSSASSWASIAKSNPKSAITSTETKKVKAETTAETQTRPSTFADAVARPAQLASKTPPVPMTKAKEPPSKREKEETGGFYAAAKKKNLSPRTGGEKISLDGAGPKPGSSDISSQKSAGGNSTSPSLSVDPTLVGTPSFYPQGYNDVIEVLCSGETTAGKLLMHFLLFYGQHFDAQTTAIDVSGKHERDVAGQAHPCSYFSPYIQRRAAGRIDPVTGMLTVDPIVVYDPLEGAEGNNVARRCFAWSSVRWVFAQAYATLSSAVERSATPPATPGGLAKNSAVSTTTSDEGTGPEGSATATSSCAYDAESIVDLMDPSSPLLRCLLSF